MDTYYFVYHRRCSLGNDLNFVLDILKTLWHTKGVVER